MGTSGPCPYCGAAGDPAGAGSAAQRHEALDAVSLEVARIRELAERSSDESRVISAQAREIMLLRETIARLRGASQAPTARPRTTASGPGTPPPSAQRRGADTPRGTLASA